MKLSRLYIEKLLQRLEECQATVDDCISPTCYLNFRKQHILFLGVCLLLKSDVDPLIVSIKFRHGGMIGYGNSVFINSLLKRSKILRIHAAFHDASGFMRREFAVSSGYSYVIGHLPNAFCVGHVTGILYWLLVKYTYPSLFQCISV